MGIEDTTLPPESVAVILARMEVKLDHSLQRGEDHESRIRALERKVWAAAGAAALVAGGLGSLLERIAGGGNLG